MLLYTYPKEVNGHAVRWNQPPTPTPEVVGGSGEPDWSLDSPDHTGSIPEDLRPMVVPERDCSPAEGVVAKPGTDGVRREDPPRRGLALRHRLPSWLGGVVPSESGGETS